jgi:hypothetical protein
VALLELILKPGGVKEFIKEDCSLPRLNIMISLLEF